MKLRVLFAGTPEMAVPSLRSVAARHDVAGVLTNPDRETGRGRKTAPSPVKTAARELGIPVFQPEKLDAAFRGIVRGLEPDILAVVAYGRIFGPQFLACFPRGGINLHPSLLPRYRGPSPINAAILNGDGETGISVQRLALRMDAGDIILQETLPLSGTETARELTGVAADRGAVLFAEALDRIAAGTAASTPQDESKATYCGLLGKEQGRIDWGAGTAVIERMVRAFDPWPGAWTLFRGESLRIMSSTVYPEKAPENHAGPGKPGKVLGVDKRAGILVQTGDGILALRELQLQSKKAMDFASFINGVRDISGCVLGDIQ